MATKQITRRPRIGFHAPIKDGLHESLIIAKDTGCDAVQIFSRNPRGWMAKPLTRESVELFAELARRGKCLLVSSHELEELEKLTDHVAIMSPDAVRLEGPVMVAGVVAIDANVWPEAGDDEENARLIAAAPDLLKAVQLVWPLFDVHGPVTNTPAWSDAWCKAGVAMREAMDRISDLGTSV